MLHVLQRQVLQLALQFVQAEFMGQRGIEVRRLLRHLHLRLHVLRVTDLPHQVHPVGNHDQDHAHVLGKGEQQVTEVLALDDGILLVEQLDAVQTVEDARHLVAVLLPHLLRRQPTLLDLRNQIDGLDGIALQTDLLLQDRRRLDSHPLLFLICKSKQIGHKSSFYAAKLQFSWNFCAFLRKSLYFCTRNNLNTS